MKIIQRKDGTGCGSTLVVTLVIIGVMGLVLFSYMAMVSHQQMLTTRSQVWNSCIAVAEAGIEEALAHLNRNGLNAGGLFNSNNLASNGWEFKNGKYFRTNIFEDGYYAVNFTIGSNPVITSTGYLPAPINVSAGGGPYLAVAGASGKAYISRTIQAQCRATGKFTKAIAARDRIELDGHNIFIDSYHSYDASASTYDPAKPSAWGLYDPKKKRDRGDVAVIAGMRDDLYINSVKVWGKVATGPNGDLKTNNNVVVGDCAWHDAGKVGVEPGWSSNDANFDISPVLKPFPTGLFPKSGWVGTNYYNYIFDNGDYKVDQLNGNVLITGQARILVTGKIDFQDAPNVDEGIELAKGARIEIYMEGDSADIRGRKDRKSHSESLKLDVNPAGNPTNFVYYGLDKNTHVHIHSCDEFTGVIYAPNAEIQIKAGSLKPYDCNFYGAVVAKRVRLEKNVSVHYDENIGNFSADTFVVESWREL